MKNKEILEEALLEWKKNNFPLGNIDSLRKIFEAGAKFQQKQDKKLYSDEEVLNLLINFNKHTLQLQSLKLGNSFNVNDWFETYKKK